MPTMKLTTTTVKRLPAPDPSGRQQFYWDSRHEGALKGFGVLVSGSSEITTYVVQGRVGKAGRPRRIAIVRARVASVKLV